jgi:hypothetical protein
VALSLRLYNCERFGVLSVTRDNLRFRFVRIFVGLTVLDL